LMLKSTTNLFNDTSRLHKKEKGWETQTRTENKRFTRIRFKFKDWYNQEINFKFRTLNPSEVYEQQDREK